LEISHRPHYAGIKPFAHHRRNPTHYAPAANSLPDLDRTLHAATALGDIQPIHASLQNIPRRNVARRN